MAIILSFVPQVFANDLDRFHFYISISELTLDFAILEKVLWNKHTSAKYPTKQSATFIQRRKQLQRIRSYVS